MHILQYSDDSLATALSNEYTPTEVIKNKNHFKYFKEYLGAIGLNAKTVVIEEKYISKDFIHDYAKYYSLCFVDYPKHCKRVHFFANGFSHEDFKAIIVGDTKANSAFWENYLGFIVVKPIPLTVIGYSVLKTYAQGVNFNERNFWGVRDYKVHVFGNEITYKSLAFQEQDSVLAACATTAIWSMLNKASADFHTVLKSPSEITQDADNVSNDGSRLFPNKNGLDILQICQAILNSGLVSEVKQPDSVINLHTGAKWSVLSHSYIKRILNAYSPIGIPLLFVVAVPNNDEYGLHALTVSGFKRSAPIAIAPSSEINWLSDNIEKIYAHDDQWGPFARIEFAIDHSINTPWTLFHTNKYPTYVTNIIVPLYPKIRISFEDIAIITQGLDGFVSAVLNAHTQVDLVWDVHLSYSEQYKEETKETALDVTTKQSILLESMPRYIWVSRGYLGTEKIIDFTFDATNVSHAMLGIGVVCYIGGLKALLHESFLLNEVFFKQLFRHPLAIKYYNHFIASLQ